MISINAACHDPTLILLDSYFLSSVAKMSSQSGRPKLVTRKPPAHFNPGRAEDEELIKADYPPRPNPELAPKKYARWQDIAARNPQYVAPGLEKGEWGLAEADNWAGAVLYASPRGAQSDPKVPKDPFYEVTGTWFVPKIHPNKVAGSNKYQDGQYRLWTWVGIDGWTNKVSLKGGITSSITVENGQVTSETTVAAILYQDGDKDSDIRVEVFKNFIVDPGDLITVDVWTTSDDDTTTGHAWIYNQGRNEYSTADIKNVPLEGVTAEWIAAGRNPNAQQQYKFPDFGATFFFHGLASHCKGKESSLERSELIDAQDLGSFTTRAEDQFLVLAHKVVERTSS